ncbi:hypothetical protein BdWA1_001160 [Babesia duncani]|uniref:Uncharacterized protein n=1 Tax=Babesia duncani TaxID=323732 RepID=A0AAD9PPC9_9APIC|nr:hypothetical protein BdWA1_001160 [Babesia duncani]
MDISDPPTVDSSNITNRDAQIWIQEISKLHHDTFGTWLRVLAILLDCEFKEPLLIDRKLPPDLESVAQYYNTPIDTETNKRLKQLGVDDRIQLSHQIARNILESIRGGLKWVLVEFEGEVSELELYTRGVAWLIKIALGAFRMEPDPPMHVVHFSKSDGGTRELSDCSLTELLTRSIAILCLFGTEHAEMFDVIGDIPISLLNIVPSPIRLYMLGAFPPVVFDPKNLFSYETRVTLAEAIGQKFESFIERLLDYTRNDVIDTVGGNLDSASVCLSPSDTGVYSSEYVVNQALRTLEDDQYMISGSNSVASSSYNNSMIASIVHSTHVSGTASINGSNATSANASATNLMDVIDGNCSLMFAASVATFMNLLKFAVDYVTLGSRFCIGIQEGVCNKLISWLERICNSSNFMTLVGHMFAMGGLICFHSVCRISNMISKDIFISWIILRHAQNVSEALQMIRIAGFEVLLLDNFNSRRVLSFLIDGLDTPNNVEYLETWYYLLKSMQKLSPQEYNSIITNAVLLDSCETLLTKLNVLAQFNLNEEPLEESALENIHNALHVREFIMFLLKLFPKFKNEDHFPILEGWLNKTIIRDKSHLEFCAFTLWILELVQSKKHAEIVKDLKTMSSETNNEWLAFAVALLGYNSNEARMLDTYARLYHLDRKLRKSLKDANYDEWYRIHAEMTRIVRRIAESRDKSGFDKMLDASSRVHMKDLGKYIRDKLDTLEPKTDEEAIFYITCVNVLFTLKSMNHRIEVKEEILTASLAIVSHFSIPDGDMAALANSLLVHCPLDVLLLVAPTPTSFRFCLLKRARDHLLNPSNYKRALRVLVVIANELICENTWSGYDFDCFCEVLEIIIMGTYNMDVLRHLLSSRANLRLMHKIVLAANTLQDNERLPLLRARLNIAILRRYLCMHNYNPETIDSAVLGTTVEFVTFELDRLMTVKSGSFSIKISGGNIPGSLSRGALATIDIIAYASFRQLFGTRIDYEKAKTLPPVRKGHAVFTWGLLSREYYKALSCVQLLFQAFSQLPNTKLLIIAQYFFSLAAQVLGENVFGIKRRFLTDDNVVRPDAALLNNYFKCVFQHNGVLVHIVLQGFVEFDRNGLVKLANNLFKGKYAPLLFEKRIVTRMDLVMEVDGV